MLIKINLFNYILYVVCYKEYICDILFYVKFYIDFVLCSNIDLCVFFYFILCMWLLGDSVIVGYFIYIKYGSFYFSILM